MLRPCLILLVCPAQAAEAVDGPNDGTALEGTAKVIHLLGSTPNGFRSEWLGAYCVYTGSLVERKVGGLLSGRRVFVQQADTSKLLWFEKHTGRWYVGKSRAYGRASGVLHVADTAMAPEQIAAKWQAWQGPKLGWVEAPNLRVVTEEQAHEIMKADATAAKASAATIRFTGNPPSGLRHEWRGAYARKGDKLVSGRPYYAKIGDDAKALWYEGKSGTWFMGGLASVGKRKGVFQARDTAVLPSAIRPGAWMVGKGRGKGWLTAPELRWLQGSEAEAEAYVIASRLASSAQTVYMLDPQQYVGDQVKSSHLAPAWQGAYTLEMPNASTPEAADGRARYVKPDHPGSVAAWMVWHNPRSGTWLLGRRSPAATRPHFAAYDGAQLPQQIASSAWRVRQEGVGSGPGALAGLKCLVGAEGASVLKAQAVAFEGILTKSATLVRLVGLPDARHEWMGEYHRQSGALVGGRHSYRHEADAAKSLWYDARNERWVAGTVQPNGAVSENTTVIRVGTGALAPEQVTGSWQVHTRGWWTYAPTLRCIADADVTAERNAKSREISHASTVVYLVGSIAPSPFAELMGAYDLVGAYDPAKTWERRVYRRRDDQATEMRYHARTGEWRVEATSGKKAMANDPIVLNAYDSALLPERISEPWQGTSGVRCVAGSEALAALEADRNAVKLQKALSPGWPTWMFPVRLGAAVEAVKAALAAGLPAVRVHNELDEARDRGIDASLLAKARWQIPASLTPPPPLPSIAPPSSTATFSPPPPSPMPSALLSSAPPPRAIATKGLKPKTKARQNKIKRAKKERKKIKRQQAHGEDEGKEGAEAPPSLTKAVKKAKKERKKIKRQQAHGEGEGKEENAPRSPSKAIKKAKKERKKIKRRQTRDDNKDDGRAPQTG